MTVLVWLVLGHLLAAFYLPPIAWQVSRQQKRVKSPGLYLGAVLYATCICLALLASVALGQLSTSLNLLWATLILTLVHTLISLAASYMQQRALLVVGEQLAYLIVITLVWGWLTGLLPFVTIWTLGFLLQREHLIILIGYLLVAKPVSVFISAVLSRQAEALTQPAAGLVEAGRMIGYVERWLIMSFVLSGQFIGIGFLLAAKSIFRFGDLSQAHERRLTEYMLLGTLMSFISALAISGLVWYLIH